MSINGRVKKEKRSMFGTTVWNLAMAINIFAGRQ